ncbi:MAG: magnesium and cobalt transport protein CorA [Micromonosporaceae bacterium]
MADRDADGSLTRAFKAPVRAVSRMIPRGNSTTETAPVLQHDHGGVVDCALYVDGVRRPGTWHYTEAMEEARRHENGFVWIGLHDPGRAVLSDIATTFELHELAVEDVVNAAQRPKLEQYEQVTFAVLRTARYVEHRELTEHTDVVETGQLMLFLGPRFVITVRHGDACRLAPVRAELETRTDLLAQGPWAVFHAVCDKVVDIYLDVASSIEGDIDSVEERVFSRDGGGDIQRIYQMKRELVEFKRAVFPLQRPLDSLVSGQVADVPKEIRRYIRNVADHLSRVTEQLSTFDDLLNSILQARLAQVTVDQNNDMRKIAAWAAIAGLQTTIAGIYGMNFTYMPELGWRYGYPLVISVMVLSAVLLHRLLRRSGWL